jgi:hypothetical protein
LELSLEKGKVVSIRVFVAGRCDNDIVPRSYQERRIKCCLARAFRFAEILTDLLVGFRGP